MSVIDALSEFVREYRTAMDRARIGRPPEGWPRDPRLRAHVDMVDGWYNTRFHQTYGTRRP